jgi:hypothetical protein
MRRAVRPLATCALLGAALMGCNLLLDLDYTTQPSPPPAMDAAVDVKDAGFEELPPLLDGSQPATWARFPIPNNPLLGFKPQHPINVVKDDAGSTQDLVTGRTWRHAGQAANFAEAVALCSKTGDRLPTRIELVSFLDPYLYKAQEPRPSLFDVDKTLAAPYWTSSPRLPRTKPEEYWFVSGADGQVYTASSTSANVMCAKGIR